MSKLITMEVTSIEIELLDMFRSSVDAVLDGEADEVEADLVIEFEEHKGQYELLMMFRKKSKKNSKAKKNNTH